MAVFFGKNTTGAQNDEVSGGYKFVSSYVLSDDNVFVSKLTLDCDGLATGAAGDVWIRGVIYTDSAGEPGTRVAEGTDVRITHTGVSTGAARAWVDLPFDNHVNLFAGTYWLGFAYVRGAAQAMRYWSAFNTGHGRNRNNGVYSPWNAVGSGATLDEDIAVYATYDQARSYTIAITAPTSGATLTSNPSTITTSYTGTGTPHHVQFEISTDLVNWTRLGAKNRVAPYTHNLNLWRFPNGTYYVRAKVYAGPLESSLKFSSTQVSFTINMAAGTVRDYVGGVDTITAAHTAASDGDTIRLTGDFPRETAFTWTKKVKMIKHPSASSPPIIRTRLRNVANATYFEDLDIRVSVDSNYSYTCEGIANAHLRCKWSNGQTDANVGCTMGSLLAFDSDGAIDPIFDQCTFWDHGDWTSATNVGAIHGVYCQNATRAYFVNCIAHHNTGFSWKLYPYAKECTVYKCLSYQSLAAYYTGGDVGMGTASTLSATLNSTDTSASITSTADWPNVGYLKVGTGAATEYIGYTSKDATHVFGLTMPHSTFSSAGACDVYTTSDYNTIELCIGGFVGNDGAGNRFSDYGIVQGRWIGSATPPKGTGNELISCFLHDPATTGGITSQGANQYVDNRTGSVDGNWFMVTVPITATDPGYLDPTSARRNFSLTGTNAKGYGPDAIQGYPNYPVITPKIRNT